ncbi:MAG: preprotein translocase subunit YajC [Planctomycetota bacterium]
MPRIVDLLSGLLVAQADGQGESGALPNLLVNLFPFVMIAVLFYLLMIRPERRKKAELNEMLENLKKNDRVVTIGGIHGTVVSTSKGAEDVTIKVDDSTNTKLKLQRSAIARVLTESGGSSTKNGS